MGTTRNARADRIHRLWMRATGNFHEASVQYDMANAAFSSPTNASPAQPQHPHRAARPAALSTPAPAAPWATTPPTGGPDHAPRH